MTPLLNDSRTEVVSVLTSVLSRIQVEYPDEVNDFLAGHEHSRKLTDQLTITHPEEVVSDLLLTSATEWLLDATYNDFLLDSTAFLMGQMPHVKSVEEWARLVFVYLINVVYQGPALKTRMWAIDIGHRVLKDPWGIAR